MAAGKSFAAVWLSQKTGWRSFDTDDLIEKRVGTALGDIFTRSGEPFFRNIEHEVLKDLLENNPDENFIIAAGGGLILQEENRLILKDALVIFLDTDFKVVLQRLAHERKKRPLITSLDDLGIETMFWQRRQKYLDYAHHVVENTESLYELVKTLVTG
ncbi:MAG: shikimate kinase [Candidatus Rifleibacteriota bacterium]